MMVAELGDSWGQTSLALPRLRLYSNGALLQAERISAAWDELHAQERANAEARARGEWTQLNIPFAASAQIAGQILIDVHAFAICWETCRQMLQYCSTLPWRAGNNVWSRRHQLFAPYKTLRDHLEHFRERLPGGDRDITEHVQSGGASQLMWSSGSLGADRTYTFAGKKYDVSQAAAEKLKSIVDEFETELADEVRKQYLRYVTTRIEEENELRAEGARQVQAEPGQRAAEQE
jgi:hypothetical protein